jgi:hypothetical protein
MHALTDNTYDAATIVLFHTDAEKDEAAEKDTMLSHAWQHIRSAHSHAVSALPEAVVQALAVALARRTAALDDSSTNTDSTTDDTESQLAELIQTATATSAAADSSGSTVAQLATALQQFAEPTVADTSSTEAVVGSLEEVDWGDSDNDKANYEETDTSAIDTTSDDTATADVAADADGEQAAETTTSSDGSGSQELPEHLLQLEHTTVRAQEARAQLRHAEVR